MTSKAAKAFFYERLLSSKNKEQVAKEIQVLESAKKPEDIIRDPYVLEFLGLSPNDDFYESDLEQALITHLQDWSIDITYIPIRTDWLYLVAIIDWHSRYVLHWEISDTMEIGFVLDTSRKIFCSYLLYF